jgi:hypothetical protein
VQVGAFAERVAPVLHRASAWQGLGEVLVADRGDAALAVQEAVRRSSGDD